MLASDPSLVKLISSALHAKSIQALLLFLTINIALCMFDPARGIDPERLSAAKSWAWWAVHNFLNERPAPNVVLLGSSLLMNPVWQNEADFLNKPFDIVANRRVRYLEAQVEKALPSSHPIVYNFALPGGIVSDDYMILRTMLQGSRKPEIVVLGLSPRDFVDNGLRCPAFSPHFRYLKRFTEIDELVDLAMPNFWQRFGYYSDRSIYVLGKKLELQAASHIAMERMVEMLVGKPIETNATAQISFQAPRKATMAMLEGELTKGVWIAKPHWRDYYQDIPVDSLRRKYRNSVDAENQRRWLELTLKMCRERGIQPVIVNMPVTPLSTTIYRPGVYDRCVELMKNEAQRYACPFLDLHNSGKFSVSDFTDFWHMDASGGRKVLDAVATAISYNPILARAIYSKVAHETVATGCSTSARVAHRPDR